MFGSLLPLSYFRNTIRADEYNWYQLVTNAINIHTSKLTFFIFIPRRYYRYRVTRKRLCQSKKAKLRYSPFGFRKCFPENFDCQHLSRRNLNWGSSEVFDSENPDREALLVHLHKAQISGEKKQSLALFL